MLGFATIGRLAVGQISTNNPIPISGSTRLRLAARAGISLSVSGRLSARTKAAASVSIGVSAQLGAKLRLSASFGQPISGWTGLRARLAAAPSIAVTGRMALRLRAFPAIELAPKGAGKNYAAMPWLPQPDYEAPQQKRFQPIWDRRRQQELEEARRKAAEPPPLPPTSIFGGPAVVTLRLDELPDYAKLVPGNWRDIEGAVREAEDASDAERLLAGLTKGDAADIVDAVGAIGGEDDRDATDAAKIVLHAVVDTEARDVAEAMAAIKQTADQLISTALRHAQEDEDRADVTGALNVLLIPEKV